MFNAEGVDPPLGHSEISTRETLTNNIRLLQEMSDNCAQAIADFVTQWAERSLYTETIKSPMALQDECEEFAIALTDLRQYVDLEKPIGRVGVEDIKLLLDSFAVDSYVVTRLMTCISDGAPWSEAKYTETWSDLYHAFPTWDATKEIQYKPNALTSRMRLYRSFLRTIT